MEKCNTCEGSRKLIPTDEFRGWERKWLMGSPEAIVRICPECESLFQEMKDESGGLTLKFIRHLDIIK